MELAATRIFGNKEIYACFPSCQGISICEAYLCPRCRPPVVVFSFHFLNPDITSCSVKKESSVVGNNAIVECKESGSF
eukprot:scaffold141687_cov34-Attheya_sp.AAC.5